MRLTLISPRKCGKTFAQAVVMTKAERTTARIALYAASLLRNTDTVVLRDLGAALHTAARHDCIPHYTDNSHLVRIMQRLGWRKVGYAGKGNRRSPRYVRVPAPASVQ